MAIGHDMYNDESYMASMQVIEDIKGCDTKLSQDPISQSSTLTEMSAKDDTSCLPAKKIRSRSCYLCGGKGHGQFNCSHLISYGAKPLNYKDLEQRQELAMNIVDYTAYKTFTRDENDERIIMKNFPKKRLPAVILHKRYLIQDNLVNNKVPDNLCIECTFLKKGGDEDINCTKLLFLAKDVATYVQRTTTNLVVSLLHRAVD